MISATAWIARGKASHFPHKYDLNETELERVSKLANIQFDDAKKQLEKAQNQLAKGRNPFGMEQGDDEWQDDGDDDEEEEDEDENENMDQEQDAKQDPDDLSRYHLEDYDEDDDVEKAVNVSMGAFSNIKGLNFYQSNDNDPYITVKDGMDGGEDDDDRQELEIYPTDNLLITAKTEDDLSQLEAYVYAANDSNLYVHHDLMLPSFPLCLEWLDYTPAPFDADQNGASTSGSGKIAGQLGNLIAVGTMDPEIEIWSMDVVEGLYPDAILGRREMTKDLDAPLGTGKKKRKQTKSRVANPDYHVGAVLSLSWNPIARNLLASASADKTVKLWDLSRPHTGDNSSALRSFDAHTDKVQSVAWQVGSAGSFSTSANPAVLLSASYDKTIRIFDTRAPETAVTARISADVEAVKWYGWSESQFLVSTEDGLVQCFDARNLPSSTSSSAVASKAIFTLAAHDSACSALDVSPHIPGCILTGSTDRTVKIWNLSSSSEQDPLSIRLVVSRDLGVGKVFSATFSPNDPLTLAAAGSSGKLQIWNCLSNPTIRSTFKQRLDKLKGSEYQVTIDGSEAARGNGLIGIDDDNDDKQDGDEDQDEAEVAAARARINRNRPLLAPPLPFRDDNDEQMVE